MLTHGNGNWQLISPHSAKSECSDLFIVMLNVTMLSVDMRLHYCEILKKIYADFLSKLDVASFTTLEMFLPYPFFSNPSFSNLSSFCINSSSPYFFFSASLIFFSASA